jgi:dihydrofolate reductase
MRRVFLQVLVSLDGFFEASDASLDWFVLDEDFFSYVNEMLGSIDGIVLGRRTYEGFAAHWPNSSQSEAKRMNELPKHVFSRTLRDADWENTTLHADDAPGVVRRLKEEPGKDLAMFGSSDLAVSLVAEGLIDELRLFVIPVVLGSGKRLLEGLPHSVGFQHTSTRTLSSGVVALGYVKRPSPER